MITVGKYNNLQIAREVTMGLFLEDNSGEEVLLPNKYCPMDYEIGNDINVFVYLDKTDRKVATNIIPDITLYEFARLKVASVTDKGAFLEWGMEKHLYVPISEQRDPLEVDEWYVVYMLQDERTEKLYATKRCEKYLQNDDLTVNEGDEVDLLIYQNAGLGLSVIINNQHKGMIYNNENFKKLKTGDKLKGWVKTIRDDDKIDISLQPIGYKNFIDPTSKLIMDALEKGEGFLPLNDKSKPEDIYEALGISKKSFKKAVGSLFKQKTITIEDNGIKII